MAVRIPARPSNEAGFTLVEMLVTMSILGLVVSGIASVLVTATKHETTLNTQFQAQESARLALTELRTDLHCADTVSPASGGATSSITLTLPAGCSSAPANGGTFTWCTVASGGTYDLWRVPAASCSTGTSGSVRWARSLAVGPAFTPDATVHTGAPVLPDVSVNLSVASPGLRNYVLTDTIYLRNGSRQ